MASRRISEEASLAFFVTGAWTAGFWTARSRTAIIWTVDRQVADRWTTAGQRAAGGWIFDDWAADIRAAECPRDDDGGGGFAAVAAGGSTAGSTAGLAC